MEVWFVISVAVTTYNGSKYIIEQLKSICDQTVPVDEIVIVDDCSTDDTVLQINTYISQQKENRIKLYVNKSNLGYTMNFYKAISKTHGDYIFLSDQDDVWIPNKVARMLKVMALPGVQIACSNFEIIDESGNFTNKGYRIPEFIQKAPKGISYVGIKTLMLDNIAQGCTYCFTSQVRDIYKKIRYFEIIHDHQLMVIGAALGKVCFINEKLIYYRIHSSNAIGFTEKKQLRGIDFRIRHKEPRMVTLLKKIRKYHPLHDYYLCVIMHYMRLPIINAVFKRFFGK